MMILGVSGRRGSRFPADFARGFGGPWFPRDLGVELILAEFEVLVWAFPSMR